MLRRVPCLILMAAALAAAEEGPVQARPGTLHVLSFGLGSSGPFSRWEGRVVGPQRIDGQTAGGVWDFRR